MDRKKFLQLMSLLESSGGKDLNHQTMTRGIHVGDTAQGQYGLMPNTIEEFKHRAKLSKRTVPKNEAQIANRLAEHLEAKTEDPEKQAYMWQYGHNLNPDEIDQETIETSPRVLKFRELKQKLGVDIPRIKPLSREEDITPLSLIEKDKYNA